MSDTPPSYPWFGFNPGDRCPGCQMTLCDVVDAVNTARDAIVAAIEAHDTNEVAGLQSVMASVENHDATETAGLASVANAAAGSGPGATTPQTVMMQDGDMWDIAGNDPDDDPRQGVRELLIEARGGTALVTSQAGQRAITGGDSHAWGGTGSTVLLPPLTIEAVGGQVELSWTSSREPSTPFLTTTPVGG